MPVVVTWSNVMKLPFEGGCLCGAVRYRISAEPRGADYCHCRTCQRSAGAPIVPWLTVASGAFTWRADVRIERRCLIGPLEPGVSCRSA